MDAIPWPLCAINASEDPPRVTIDVHVDAKGFTRDLIASKDLMP